MLGVLILIFTLTFLGFGPFSGLSFKLAGRLGPRLSKAGNPGFYNLLADPLLLFAPTPRVCYNLFKVLTDGIIPILRIIVVVIIIHCDRH